MKHILLSLFIVPVTVFASAKRDSANAHNSTTIVQLQMGNGISASGHKPMYIEPGFVSYIGKTNQWLTGFNLSYGTNWGSYHSYGCGITLEHYFLKNNISPFLGFKPQMVFDSYNAVVENVASTFLNLNMEGGIALRKMGESNFGFDVLARYTNGFDLKNKNTLSGFQAAFRLTYVHVPKSLR